MNNLRHEAYRQQLQEIAAEYEAHGYEVLVEPRPEQLPEFLRVSVQILLLADQMSRWW